MSKNVKTSSISVDFRTIKMPPHEQNQTVSAYKIPQRKKTDPDGGSETCSFEKIVFE